MDMYQYRHTNYFTFLQFCSNSARNKWPLPKSYHPAGRPLREFTTHCHIPEKLISNQNIYNNNYQLMSALLPHQSLPQGQMALTDSAVNPPRPCDYYTWPQTASFENGPCLGSKLGGRKCEKFQLTFAVKMD